MNAALTIECRVHLHRRAKGQKQLRAGPAPAAPPPGRVPRVSRLMVLALRCEQLLREGTVRDYAELARLGHVSRARVTQVMNLLHLAPDLQEALLFLPPVTAGRDGLILAQLQPLAAALDWRQQRRLWGRLQPADRRSLRPRAGLAWRTLPRSRRWWTGLEQRTCGNWPKCWRKG